MAVARASANKDSNVVMSLADLTGPQKAAVIILSLGAEAQPVLRLFEEDELKEVSQAMSNLGVVDSSVVEHLIIEFVQQLSTSGGVVGSHSATERLLASILPREKVDALMEDIRGPAGRTMWDKLGNVNEQVLANYLKNEYPQTVAVVLSKVKPDHAARVLTALPDDFAIECVHRMLRMEPVQRDILDKIEGTLRTEFMSNLARTPKRDSHELMAEIFNTFDRQTEARFISALEERSREAAERIRALMFVFEDLKKLDAGGVQTLMRVADKADLALALKGASDELRNLFLSNMSERASKILKDDMAAMGPVRLKDVEGAQTRMVAAAKDLADRGEIMLASSGGEEELIY
jgi:flagellar motor switch protein FliG